jgi:hypothetical protein
MVVVGSRRANGGTLRLKDGTHMNALVTGIAAFFVAALGAIC